MSRKDDPERNKKIVGELVKLAENQLCADCGAKGPRWASANLGLFMCIRCSGIHRNLGVHISFVRSVSLDEWKASQVENMVRWGNKRANEYWEALVPADYYIPDENDSVQLVERWIRDKYEKGKFKSKTRARCADMDVDVSASMADVLAVARGSSGGGEKESKAAAKAAKASDKSASSAAPAVTIKASGGGVAAAPKATPAPAAASVASPDTFDLLGFDAFPVSSAPAAAPAVAAPAVVGGKAADIMSLFGGSGAGGGQAQQQQQSFGMQHMAPQQHFGLQQQQPFAGGHFGMQMAPQQQQFSGMAPQQQQFSGMGGMPQQLGSFAQGGAGAAPQPTFNPFAGQGAFSGAAAGAASAGSGAHVPLSAGGSLAAAKPPAPDAFADFASFS